MPATRIGRGYPGRSRVGVGFSLIELMVVIAVIAMMASLLLSALHSAKEKSRSVMCRSNMKQLAYAFSMYADENRDFFPWPGGEPDRANNDERYTPDWCAGGQTPEQIRDPRRWQEDTFGYHPEAGSIFSYVLSRPRLPYDEKYKEEHPIYRCPSTGTLGDRLRVNYVANRYMDPDSPFGKGRVGAAGVLKTSIIDPVRKILLMNEDPQRLTGAGFAPSPTAASGSPVLHQGRVNVSFMDLHIEALSSRFVEAMQTEHVDEYYNLGHN